MARRARGSGTVIALVIFVVLTFIAAGAAVWFYQKASAAQVAMQKNQSAFEQQIADYFTKQNWDMPREAEPGVLNVRYGSSSFSAVQSQLQKAATYEKLSRLVGWKSPDAAQTVLNTAALTRDLGTEYQTVSALLGAYEQEYADQKQARSDLRGKVDSLQQQLRDKTQVLDETTTRLRNQLNAEVSDYEKKLDQLSQKVQELAQTHQEQTDKTEEWRQKYRQATDAAEQEIQQLQQELQQAKETIQRLRTGEKPEKMVAQGQVLELDREYRIAIIAGGEDVNRRRDQKLVVYEEMPGGERVKKGEISITQVHSQTSSASIVREEPDMRISEGDSCVLVDIWHKFHGSKAASAPGQGAQQS